MFWCRAGRTARFGLWEAKTGNERAVFKGHTGAVAFVTFAPDGKTAASAGSDGTVRVWDVATGKGVRHDPVRTHRRGVGSGVFAGRQGVGVGR